MSKNDKKNRPLVADGHLWTEVARTVSPIRKKPVPPSPVMKTRLPATPEQDFKLPAKNRPAQPVSRNFTLPVRPPPPMADKPMEPKLRRKVMRGHIPIDGTIDLHGMRQSEAHAALHRFITARFHRGDRTVLVITGKGLKKTGYAQIEQKGVLRTMLPLWLAEPALAPLVSGFQVSAQAHGGEGAYYVRLKRAVK